MPIGSASVRTVVALACLACATSASAQNRSLRADIPPLDQLASDALARLALTTLREIPDPTTDDYRLAALGLRIARRVYPEDTELLRLEIEAWDAAEDPQAIDATRELVRIDPGDDVAWLRLIDHNLSLLQTADARLESYERLLGPAGERLDPTVRSRLALDAALLAREMGDEDLFVERLTDATALDVTNKNAAALYATYFMERTDDPLVEAELLGNVLIADPVDPAALTNLADLLFAQRAFRGAQRFYALARQVREGSGDFLGPEDLFDRILVKWMVEGERAALRDIKALRNHQQSFLNSERRRRIAVGLDPGAEEDAQVPAVIELIRLAIGFSVRGFAEGEQSVDPDDPESMRLDEIASDSVRRSLRAVTEALELLEQREPPYDQFSDEDVESLVRSTKAQFMVVRLWAGEQIDEAEAGLDEMTSAADQSELTPEAIQRFRGLIALRRGEALGPSDGAMALARARAMLEPLSETDLLARLGMGILEEVESNPRRAIGHYAKLAVEHANSAIGCAARIRAELLLGRPIPQEHTAAELDEWAMHLAPWLERLTIGPRRFMALSAGHLQKRTSPFERLMLRIELRNISSRPLALGSGATIDSEILLAPRVTMPGRDRSPLEMPEILDFDQRLRLMPGESIRRDVWVNRGTLGMLLDLNAHTFASLRWRVLQGYHLDADRNYTHGPFCLSTESDLIDRYNLEPRVDAQELSVHIVGASGSALMEDLLLSVVTGSRRVRGMSDRDDEARRLELAKAIATRMPDMDPYQRAYVYAIGIRGGLLVEGSALLEHARSESNPLALASLMVGAFRRAGDEMIPALLDSEDEDIRAMARIISGRMTPDPS